VKASAVPAPAATMQSDQRPSVPTLTPLDSIVLETERLQAHCIAILEERVHLMDDRLQATRRMAEEALAKRDRHDSLFAAFAGRLATAKSLLATV
jgi:hypothetical protein